jgi:hypothetical protein
MQLAPDMKVGWYLFLVGFATAMLAMALTGLDYRQEFNMDECLAEHAVSHGPVGSKALCEARYDGPIGGIIIGFFMAGGCLLAAPIAAKDILLYGRT